MVLDYDPQPVRRFLADDVARHLRDAILAGALAPGAVLPEGELARSYGVSGTTLRAALVSLQSAGLIELIPNRSPRVIRPEYDDAAGALVTLGVLMRGVIAHAVPTMASAERADQVDAISVTIAAVRAADIDALRADTIRGYHRWADSCRNQPLARVLHERADSLTNALVRTDTTPPQGVVLAALTQLRTAVDSIDVHSAVRAVGVMHRAADAGSNRAFQALSNSTVAG